MACKEASSGSSQASLLPGLNPCLQHMAVSKALWQISSFDAPRGPEAGETRSFPLYRALGRPEPFLALSEPTGASCTRNPPGAFSAPHPKPDASSHLPLKLLSFSHSLIDQVDDYLPGSGVNREHLSNYSNAFYPVVSAQNLEMFLHMPRPPNRPWPALHKSFTCFY